MQDRTFYVALGIRRHEAVDDFLPEYREIMVRYRRVMEEEEQHWDDRTDPPLLFGALVSHAARRHGGVFAALFRVVRTAQAEVDRFYGGFVPEVVHSDGGLREKDLFTELRMTAKQARTGGLVAVHLPVVRECPSCRLRRSAQESWEPADCNLCIGAGRVFDDVTLELCTPPGMADGRVVRVSLEDVGLRETGIVAQTTVTRS